MSPIDKIRKGIIENDMQQIIKGFGLLTGEKIEPREGEEEGEKPEEPSTEEAVRPSAQVRSKDLDFSTGSKEGEDSDHGQREPVRAKKNQFVDDGTEALVSEDPELKTPSVPLTQRRPPVSLTEVTCHICGAKEEINIKYKAGQFHRCGKCVG
tara:strand:- start:1248 stop:1706 length:459 start_codon:yes stop_codon:yes gene_type:complete